MNNLWLINEIYTNGYTVQTLDVLSILAFLAGILLITSKSSIVVVLSIIVLFANIVVSCLISGNIDFITLSQSKYIHGIINILSFIFIFVVVFTEKVGKKVCLNIGYEIMSIFKLILLKLSLIVQNNLKAIFIGITLMNLGSVSLFFFLDSFSLVKSIVTLFLNLIPFIGLIALSFIDHNLVLFELIKRITFYAFFFLVFIIITIFGVLLWIIEPDSVNIIIPLLWTIRLNILKLTLIYLLRHVWFMAWSLKNFIELGVLFFSLCIIGNLFFVCGKFSSAIFLKEFSPTINNKVENILPFSNLDGESISKLKQDMYPTYFGLETESLKITLSTKRSIRDIMPSLLKNLINSSNWSKDISLALHVYTFPKIRGVSLLKGFISLDLTKSIPVSCLLKDTSLYDTSSALWVTHPYLITNKPSIQELIYKRYYSNFEYLEILNKLTWLHYVELINQAEAMNYKYKLPDLNNTFEKEGEKFANIPSSFQIDHYIDNPLYTERLVLRPITLGDLEDIELFYKDYYSNWYTSLVYSEFNIPDTLNSSIYDLESLVMGVFLKCPGTNKEGKLIGEICSSIMHNENKYVPSVSFKFSRDYLSQGYGTEAVKEFLDYYFNLPGQDVKIKYKDFYKHLDLKEPKRMLNNVSFLFNTRSNGLHFKLGFKMDYINTKQRCPSEVNIWTRQVRKMGLDLLTPKGQIWYRFFFNYKKPVKYINRIDVGLVHWSLDEKQYRAKFPKT